MSLPKLSLETKKEFFEKFAPYAQKASQRTNIPASAILAQWANESYFGASNVAVNALNFGGIKYTGRSDKYGVYAKYTSVDEFVNDYVRVMNLGYYKAVRDDTTNKPEWEESLLDLAKSPYAESGYGGGWGLIDLVKSFGLTKYDGKLQLPIPPVVQDDSIQITIPPGTTKNNYGYLILGIGALVVAGVIAID